MSGMGGPKRKSEYIQHSPQPMGPNQSIGPNGQWDQIKLVQIGPNEKLGYE